MKTLIAAFSIAIVSAIPVASLASNAEEVRERVQKVGKLNVGGDAAAPAATVAPAASAAPDAAAEAPAENATAAAAPSDTAAQYQASCFACHATGAAGAPILGDSAAWAPRIAQGEATLLEHVINGFNAMPPRGASMFSDDELKALVSYMVENSQ